MQNNNTDRFNVGISWSERSKTSYTLLYLYRPAEEENENLQDVQMERKKTSLSHFDKWG